MYQNERLGGSKQKVFGKEKFKALYNAKSIVCTTQNIKIVG